MIKNVHKIYENLFCVEYIFNKFKENHINLLKKLLLCVKIFI